MKKQTKSSLGGLAKPVGYAALTALFVLLAELVAGCTTVIVPNDQADTPAVTVTGAIPLGIQLNTKTN